MRALRILPLLAAAACSQGLAPGLDLFNCDGGVCPDPGVIQGQLVFTGAARGDAILLLFDTAALPPPDGNATQAVAVARISRQQLFGSAAAGSVGPFSAAYTFTEVPSGHSYQVRAFLDVAGSFNPTFDFTLSPRAGAVAGGFGTIVNGQPQLLAVSVGPDQVVTGINVALLQTLPFDPPAFTIEGGSQTFASGFDRPFALTLKSAQLAVPDATLPRAHFAVELDRGADGNPKSSFGDGIVDVFPRVVLRQLTTAGGDPASTAIVPCRTLATSILPQVLALPPGAAPLPLDTLTVLVEPVALDAATLAPLAAIPPGVYAVVAIEKSGQVWTVPNSLGQPARGADFVASQGASITFTAAPAAAAGSISGQMAFHGGAGVQSGDVIVQAFKDDPQNPPPPLGAAQPARIALVRGSTATPTADGFTLEYALTGLSPGSYIVEALDDVNHDFAPIDLLQTPTKGDLTGAVVDPATFRPKSIAVASAAVGGQDLLLQPVALDPPVFTVDDAQGPAAISVNATQPARFGLIAHPFSFPAGAAAQPIFTVALVKDAAGNTVDADHDGLPDAWPRIFLERLDEGDTTLLTPFARTQLIPAAVDPTPFLGALATAPAVLATQISVVVRPALVDATDPDAKTVGALQAGDYRIVVINQTGQVWQIPNQAEGVDPSQARSFHVTVP